MHAYGAWWQRYGRLKNMMKIIQVQHWNYNFKSADSSNQNLNIWAVES